VSGLTAEQRRVAELLFALPEAHGFALAGGSALVALRLVDRPTRDLDAFVAARAGRDPGSVEPLLDAVVSAMEAAGWRVAVVRRHQIPVPGFDSRRRLQQKSSSAGPFGSCAVSAAVGRAHMAPATRRALLHEHRRGPAQHSGG